MLSLSLCRNSLLDNVGKQFCGCECGYFFHFSHVGNIQTHNLPHHKAHSLQCPPSHLPLYYVCFFFLLTLSRFFIIGIKKTKFLSLFFEFYSNFFPFFRTCKKLNQTKQFTNTHFRNSSSFIVFLYFCLPFLFSKKKAAKTTIFKKNNKNIYRTVSIPTRQKCSFL